MLPRAGSRADTALREGQHACPDHMGMLSARLTSSGRRQARHLVGIGVVAGKRAVRIVVLVVPHGAGCRAAGIAGAMSIERAQTMGAVGLSSVWCARAVKLRHLQHQPQRHVHGPPGQPTCTSIDTDTTSKYPSK